jgi:hypothetical protein
MALAGAKYIAPGGLGDLNKRTPLPCHGLRIYNSETDLHRRRNDGHGYQVIRFVGRSARY